MCSGLHFSFYYCMTAVPVGQERIQCSALLTSGFRVEELSSMAEAAILFIACQGSFYDTVHLTPADKNEAGARRIGSWHNTQTQNRPLSKYHFLSPSCLKIMIMINAVGVLRKQHRDSVKRAVLNLQLSSDTYQWLHTEGLSSPSLAVFQILKPYILSTSHVLLLVVGDLHIS